MVNTTTNENRIVTHTIWNKCQKPLLQEWSNNLISMTPFTNFPTNLYLNWIKSLSSLDWPKFLNPSSSKIFYLPLLFTHPTWSHLFSSLIVLGSLFFCFPPNHPSWLMPKLLWTINPSVCIGVKLWITSWYAYHNSQAKSPAFQPILQHTAQEK